MDSHKIFVSFALYCNFPLLFFCCHLIFFCLFFKLFHLSTFLLFHVIYLHFLLFHAHKHKHFKRSMKEVRTDNLLQYNEVKKIYINLDEINLKLPGASLDKTQLQVNILHDQAYFFLYIQHHGRMLWLLQGRKLKKKVNKCKE